MAFETGTRRREGIFELEGEGGLGEEFCSRKMSGNLAISPTKSVQRGNNAFGC